MARPWRLAFVGYWLALTVGTHWPDLQLQTGVGRFPDKLAHILAFGGLTILLLRTRWLGAAWLAGLLIVLWAALDEISQALPGLRRTISWQDLIAGQTGVVVVMVWWWALRPLGGPGNRSRLAWQAFLLDELFHELRTWALVGLAAAAGAILIGAVTWLALWSGLELEPAEAVAYVGVAAAAGAVAAAHVVLAAMCRRRGEVLQAEQPCFECGAPCRGAAFDALGRGRCPGCGVPNHGGQWGEPMSLPLAAALRGTLPAALAAAGLLFAAGFAYGAVLGLSAQLTVAKDLLRAWQALTPDMRLVVDLAGIALAFAVAARLYRVLQGRAYDRQHLRCRSCRHDLTRTPLERGIGRCGECGMAFVRISDA